MTKIYKELIIVNLFILTLLLSTISNYSLFSFVLKSLSSIILIITIITFQKVRIVNSIFFVNILVFTSLPLISLLWSSNINFGVLKILNIIVGVVPLIWVAEILYKNRTESRNKLLIKSLIFLSLVFSLVIIFYHPFEYNTAYIFNIRRWSHVIIGRFLSASIIVILLFDMYYKYRNRKLFYTFLTIIFLGLYLSGFRSGFIFSLFISFIIFTSYKSLNRNYAYIIIGAIISIIFFIAFDFFLYDSNIFSRYLGLFNNQPRIEAFKITWELFKTNPLLGVGIGGFTNSSVLGEIMKYPHNLIAEVLAEFGLLGLFWLVFLLSLLFIKNNREPRFYLLLAFLLSLTSKDISTNTMLWIGLSSANPTHINKKLMKISRKYIFTNHIFCKAKNYLSLKNKNIFNLRP